MAGWRPAASPRREPLERLILAFQSQALHTDDVTGHALPGSRRFEDVARDRVVPPPPNGFKDGVVRIAGALVNPFGHDPGLESVTLVNLSPEPLDLAGWQIADRNDDRVTVRLSDINGPKGGVDHKCLIKVVLSGLPSVVVERQDSGLQRAVNAAIAAAAQAVRRSVQRRRLKPLHRRRPRPANPAS